MSFDDFLRRATAQDTPDSEDASASAPVRWEFETVHTDAKHLGKVMEKMSRKGWEYVEQTKNPILALRPPLAVVFRRPRA